MRKNKLLRAVCGFVIFIGLFLLANSSHAAAEEIKYQVTDYGVIGDGKTDNTYAINSLLETVSEFADEDTLVLEFPKGRYNISNFLKIYSNTTLQLDKEAEIYQTNTSKPMLLNVGEDGTFGEESQTGGYILSHDIKICGGIFNGGDIAKADTTGNTVNIAHAQNVTIQNTTFKNNYGAHLLELSGVKNATISGCDFSGFRPEKKSDNSNEYLAKECIQLDYTYNHATNSSLQWCPGYYSDKTACQNILIEENKFHDYPRGVGNHHGKEVFSSLNLSKVTIKNNEFTNMYVKTSNGKKLLDSVIMLHSFKDAVVENNVIQSAETGIMMVYDTGSTIRNNKMNDLTGSGIVVAKNSSNSVITGNSIMDSSRYGISVTGTSNVKTFSNNKLNIGAKKKKMINGVTVTGANAWISTITGNTIANCSKIGISLLSVKKVKTISKNKIYSCPKAAICIAKSAGTSIQNNTLKGVSKQNTVIITGKSKVVSITGNTITNTGKNAISVGDSSKVSSIANNEIKNTTGNAICIFAKSNVGTILSNKITKSKIGISVLNSTCDKVNKNSIDNSSQYGICSTTAVLNYVQNNKISSAKKGGILFCKKSRKKKISGNKFSKISKKKQIIIAKN